MKNITVTDTMIDFGGCVYFPYKLPKTKENTFIKAMHLFANSWTWDRMTEEERGRLYDVLRYSKVIGTYDQRFKQYHSLYYAFMLGLGCTDLQWRSPNN